MHRTGSRRRSSRKYRAPRGSGVWCWPWRRAALGGQASGRASSPIPSTRYVIHLDFIGGRPQKSNAVLFRPDTELMSCCENVYEEWCPNSNLFADRASAQKWATEHGLQGRVLTLTKANELATEEWKSLTNGGEVDLDSKS